MKTLCEQNQFLQHNISMSSSHHICQRTDLDCAFVQRKSLILDLTSYVAIMSAPVHAKAAENTTKPEDTKSAPQLGALEEDDEFEEFAAEGINRIARNLLA